MGNRKVGIITVFSDMIGLVGRWYWGFWMVFILSALFIVLYFDVILDKEELPKILLNVIPELMGFLIAGLAIIMGLNEGTLKQLSEKADDRKIPIRVICASFSVCIIMLLLTLTLCVIYDCSVVNCKCYNKVLSWLIIGGLMVSIESVFHVVFHLFATSTHLVIK